MRNLSTAWIRLIGLVALTLTIGIATQAQTVSGTLRGNVTDANDAVVPNANVVVRNKETGLERTVTTSEDGVYNIPFLPIGEYEVEISRTDFNKVTR